jgi:hypothetical protein
MSEHAIMRWADLGAVFALGLGLSLGSLACNQVTGVGDLEVRETGLSGDGAGGAGGAGSSGAGLAGSGASVTTGGGTLCEYPKQGFGNKVGGVVKPGLKWEGFAEASDAAGTVSMEDYYDCDGTKGINAVLLLTSATWCGSCQQEAMLLKGTGSTYAKWQELGIKVITLMIDDAQPNQPATLKTAEAWKAQFKLENAVVADPSFSFAPPTGGSIGLPYQVLVDPRTMTIVDVQEGYSGSHASTLELAAKNAPQ